MILSALILNSIRKDSTGHEKPNYVSSESAQETHKETPMSSNSDSLPGTDMFQVSDVSVILSLQSCTVVWLDFVIIWCQSCFHHEVA